MCVGDWPRGGMSTWEWISFYTRNFMKNFLIEGILRNVYMLGTSELFKKF